MPGIEFKKDLIVYYGNNAGYVENGTAVVDNMFNGEELNEFLQEKGLTAKWTDGVFDRLTSTELSQTPSYQAEVSKLKDCRIWQLRDDVDPMMKFIGFDELQKRGFDSPDANNYNCVYDAQIETNNLDKIWDKLNMELPNNYQGHSLSISDVVELYDRTGSEFHYVDSYGFKEINFSPQQVKSQETGQSHIQSM